MNVSYEGIGPLYVTFAGEKLEEGAPVRMSANGTVTVCSKSNELIGVVAAVSRDGQAGSVQLRGFVTLPYSGTTAPSLGYCPLVADGSGGVKTADSSARQRLVAAVDAEKSTVTFLL